MKRHRKTRARAKILRAGLTPPERVLWNQLRANRLGVKFQRQVVLAPYIADYAARSLRLVVELDGNSHAGREAYDATRTAELQARGYRVLRFSNSEVMTNLDGVVRSILVALGRDPEIPSPPLGGEGPPPRSGGRERGESRGRSGWPDSPLSPTLSP